MERRFPHCAPRWAHCRDRSCELTDEAAARGRLIPERGKRVEVQESFLGRDGSRRPRHGRADYVLTTSGASTVGGTRNFSLTFNEGPTNGGPPASGFVYYYFSVNGT